MQTQLKATERALKLLKPLKGALKLLKTIVKLPTAQNADIISSKPQSKSFRVVKDSFKATESYKKLFRSQ